jgi:hypothetical protein
MGRRIELLQHEVLGLVPRIRDATGAHQFLQLSRPVMKYLDSDSNTIKRRFVYVA